MKELQDIYSLQSQIECCEDNIQLRVRDAKEKITKMFLTENIIEDIIINIHPNDEEKCKYSGYGVTAGGLFYPSEVIITCKYKNVYKIIRKLDIKFYIEECIIIKIGEKPEKDKERMTELRIRFGY